MSLWWKHGILTTGPPGKSSLCLYLYSAPVIANTPLSPKHQTTPKSRQFGEFFGFQSLLFTWAWGIVPFDGGATSLTALQAGGPHWSSHIHSPHRAVPRRIRTTRCRDLSAMMPPWP